MYHRHSTICSHTLDLVGSIVLPPHSNSSFSNLTWSCKIEIFMVLLCGCTSFINCRFPVKAIPDPTTVVNAHLRLLNHESFRSYNEDSLFSHHLVISGSMECDSHSLRKVSFSLPHKQASLPIVGHLGQKN